MLNLAKNKLFLRNFGISHFAFILNQYRFRNSELTLIVQLNLNDFFFYITSSKNIFFFVW